MKQVILLINGLKKNKQLVSTINKKINAFKNMQNKSSKKLFQELCFCILTANYVAKKAIDIQEKINDGFNNFSEKKLATYLKKNGHRFPNTRARYIFCSREHQSTLKKTIFSFNNSYERREWLVKNIKGLGYKEASHFLRNIGFLDLAIIDFHILDFLESRKLIKKPKTISKKVYIDTEQTLRKIAEKVNMSLGELDLYLWYYETNTVYK